MQTNPFAGTLYSLLSSPKIREYAMGMGMEAVVHAQIDVSEEKLAAQLKYIEQQLMSGGFV